MNLINEYVMKVHELIEVPRNELRKKVYAENKTEYKELLEKYEQVYFEKCLKVEEMLEDRYAEMKLREKGKSS